MCIYKIRKCITEGTPELLSSLLITFKNTAITERDMQTLGIMDRVAYDLARIKKALILRDLEVFHQKPQGCKRSLINKSLKDIDIFCQKYELINKCIPRQ
jgi:hypothetical protein